MAINKIKFKRTSVAGRLPTPSQVDVGEILINMADKKIYTKNDAGVIINVGGAGADFIRKVYEETNVKGKTVFPAQYDIDFVDVEYNGIGLAMTDYIATDGVSIILKVPVAQNTDIIKITAFRSGDISEVNGTNIIFSPADGPDSVKHVVDLKADKVWVQSQLDTKATITSLNTKVSKTGDTMTGNLKITNSENAEIRVDTGANKTSQLYLSEDSANHGAFFKYRGDTSDNRLEIGMRNANVESTLMSSNRGSNIVKFTATPTVGVNKIYHEGNKPLLSDLGGTAAYAGQLVVNTDTNWKPTNGHLKVNSTPSGANSPEGSTFTDYITWGHRGGGNYYHSLYVPHNGDRAHQLCFTTTDTTGTLTPYAVYTEKNKPTPSAVGAVAKTGDTMTGPLTVNMGDSPNPKLILKRDSGPAGNVSILFEAQANHKYLGLRADGHFGYGKDVDLSGENSSLIYSTSNKPTSSDVGSYSKAEADAKFIQSGSGAAIDKSKSVIAFDTRSTNPLPLIVQDFPGVRFDFKTNSTDGYSQGGLYHGVMTFRPYGSTSTDKSGGGTHQLAFGQNGRLGIRYGESTWGNWDYLYSTTHKPTWNDVGGNRFIKEVTESSVSFLKVAQTKWLSAGSTTTGFLPNNIGTADSSNSYIGASSWWFREAWVNRYRGGSLDLNGGGNLNSALLIQGTTFGNSLPSVDQLKVDGYGIIGNRGTVYISNGSPSSGASLAFGLGGTFSQGNKLVINNTVITSSVPIAASAGTAAAHLTRKDYVDTQDRLKVSKSGDTMTGPLTLTGHNGIKTYDGKNTLWSHDNKAVTLSAAGSGGTLILGYNVGDTYQTGKVSLGSNLYGTDGTTLISDTTGKLYDMGKRVYSENYPPSAGTIGSYTKAESDGRYPTKGLEKGQWKDITVGGDANTFYPVLIGVMIEDGYGFKRVSVSRGYNWTGPAWNNPTHKGGCTATIKWSGDSGWGGNTHSLTLEEWSNQYTTVLGGLAYINNGLLVWLRGGGAQYRVSGSYGNATPVTITLGSYTDAGGTVYPVKTLAQAGTSFTDAQKYWNNRHGAVYDNNTRVYSAVNKPTNDVLNLVSRSGDTMTGTLSINKGSEGVFLRAPAGQASYFVSSVGGTSNWYVGKGGSSNDVALHSYAHSRNINIKTDGVYIEGTGQSGKVYTTAYKPSPEDIGAPKNTSGTVSSQDWNTLTIAGTYTVNNASGANRPKDTNGVNAYNYGALQVQNTGAIIIQTYTSDNNLVYVRSKFSTNSWGAWKAVGGDGQYQNRTAHSNGYQIGSYNNVGPNSVKTNPIYAIGSAYKPTDDALGNMYGIGYCGANSTFIPNDIKAGSHWGMYVAAEGDARIFLSGGDGQIKSTGAITGGGFITHPHSYPSLTLNFNKTASGANKIILEGSGESASGGNLNIIARNTAGTNQYVISFPKVTGTVYTSGNKPTLNDLTGKAADSEKLDGLSSESYLRDNGWNPSPGQAADTQPYMSADFTYANGAPYTGSIVHMGASGYGFQMNNSYGSITSQNMAFRTRNGDTSSWNKWRGISTAWETDYGMSSSGQWHLLAEVDMPNSASTIVIEVSGGSGFNLGSVHQLGTQKIHIRTGNGSPATGLSIVGFYDGGLDHLIKDIGYKYISGSKYEVYALSAPYPTAGLIWSARHSYNAKFVWKATAVGASAPSGITKWIENNATYNTRAKPTWDDVGGNLYWRNTVISGTEVVQPTSRWISSSERFGYLPSKASTGDSATSLLGTSSWWFKESWVNSYRGGSVNVSGNITAYSDIRVKTNIKVIENALDKVNQIRGVTYERTDLDDGISHCGVIAQEIEKVLPEVVIETKNGDIEDFKTVAYGNISALLIEAIKELKAEVDNLRSEIKELKDGK
jgi:hypothetical protein